MHVSQLDTPSEIPGTAHLSQGYSVAGPYDEMCVKAGEIRSHWSYLMTALNDMGGSELQRRREEAWRLIRDNDVTYNIYGDPSGMGRPWELDLVPLLIESEEWRQIEAGLVQRAELLNLLLRDLYGPRNLVSKGILPAELVYAHPGFLRPCAGIPLPDTDALTFYAADLVRGEDGQMAVMSDRAQSPSGAGYALENRMVISRVLPSLFRDSHTHRLANFFRSTRQTMNRLSPRQETEPNVVLLSPGPANEAYFEHAYLANYLGHTLVEGSDLTVRDDKVWLNTLDGRLQVDVIMRRMDDGYCDPVELREDSYLGVPGLTNVARMGNVSIANPLGSGVLENPALASFLPALAKHFLGEELRIPSVPSWWCGNAIDRQYVLENLPRMVIKPVHPSLGFRFAFGAELSKKQLGDLRAKILARPHLYAGQEMLSMSTVPILDRNGLHARRTVLRTFLVSGEHDYQVMPGGLTRVSSAEDKLVVSNQAGGISKDTWVLASEPEKQSTLLTDSRQPRPTFERGAEVPGRVADNLFWVGRYAERAEFNSRLLRLALQYLVTGEGEASETFKHQLMIITQQTMTGPGSITDPAIQLQLLKNPEQELLSIITDGARYGSLVQTLSSLLLSARSVRDRLSNDTWRVINDIDEELRSLRNITPGRLSDALDELDSLITALSAFSGLTMENMTRGRSWRFLDIGRRLERGLQTTRLLQATLVPVSDQNDEIMFSESILTIVDSMMSYRRTYRRGIQIPDLLDLVLYSERNPRSVAYQLSRIEEHIADLPHKESLESRSELERLSLETATMVRLADVNRLAKAGKESMRREVLDPFLAALTQRLPALSDALTATYFRAKETPHQLVQFRSRKEQ